MTVDGQRFSQQYLDRSVPARDSVRFRNRLASFFKQAFSWEQWTGVATAITTETGAVMPYIGGSPNISKFIQESEVRDILDMVTIVFRHFNQKGFTSAKHWLVFVERAFREESLGYRVDKQGGVHYYIDEEFERGRVSTVSGLTDVKYAGVAAAIADAFRHMDTADTKAAVRSVFEALEILVKQMVQTNNLNKWLVDNTLKETCLAQYSGDPTGRKVEEAMFASFGQWVEGIHNYRHGQGSVSPVAPSDELAVHILSTGCAYVRWLAGHHRAMLTR